MRLVIIGCLAGLLAGCATPVRIDWAGTGQGIMQSACRNSTRCDVPACDQASMDKTGCDNPYIRRTASAAASQIRP